MKEQTEIIVPFQDLTRFSFDCTLCEAEVLVDISKDKHRRIEENAHDHPMRCSVCGAMIDSGLKTAFSSLIDWYQKALTTGHKISFRIRRD